MTDRKVYISPQGNTFELRSLQDAYGNDLPIEFAPEEVKLTKLVTLDQVDEDQHTLYALFLGADNVIKKRRLDPQLFSGKKFVTEDKWIVLKNTDKNIIIDPWHQQRPRKNNTWEFKLADHVRIKTLTVGDLHVTGSFDGSSTADDSTTIVENPYTWNLSVNGSSQAVPTSGTVNVLDGSAITIDQSGLGFVVNHADTSNYDASTYSGAWVISRIDADTYGHIQEVTARELTIGDLGGPYDNYVKWIASDDVSSIGVTSNKVVKWKGLGSTVVTLDATANTFEISSADVSAVPGGADTNVQYNDSGSFGGSSSFRFNKLTSTPAVFLSGSASAIYSANGGAGGNPGYQFRKSNSVQGGIYGINNQDKIGVFSNTTLAYSVTIDLDAPVNSLDVDASGNVVSAQDIRGATLRTTDVISAASLATDSNGDIIAGSGTGLDASTTITINGTATEVEVTPNGTQDASSNPSWTIGLPDDVDIDRFLTVGATISLPDSTSVTHGVFYIGGESIHNYGTNNVFFGTSPGNFTNTGLNNVGIGSSVLSSLTTGDGNVSIGLSSMTSATTSNYGVAIGRQSFSTSTAPESGVAVGDLASYLSTDGSYSVAIGWQALKQDGSQANVAIGGLAGTETGLSGAAEFLSGTNNTFIGYGTRYDASAISYSTAIGSGVTLTRSNTVVIGRSLEQVGIAGVNDPQNDLDVGGGIRAILPDATAPQLVGYDSNNDLVAVDPSTVAVGPTHYSSTETTVQGSGSNPTVGYTARQFNFSKSGRNVIANLVLQIASYSGGSGDALIDFSGVSSEFSIWADPSVPRQPLGTGFIYDATGGGFSIQACRRASYQMELSYVNVIGTRSLLQTSDLQAGTEIWLPLAYASN